MCVACSFILSEILPYGDQLHLLKLYGYNQTLAIMITIRLNALHNCIEHALAPVFYFSAFLILELALVRIVIMCNTFIKCLSDSTFYPDIIMKKTPKFVFNFFKTLYLKRRSQQLP